MAGWIVVGCCAVVAACDAVTWWARGGAFPATMAVVWVLLTTYAVVVVRVIERQDK